MQESSKFFISQLNVLKFIDFCVKNKHFFAFNKIYELNFELNTFSQDLSKFNSIIKAIIRLRDLINHSIEL